MPSAIKHERINVSLLRRIQRHISEEPNRFFMGSWIHAGVAGDLPYLDGIKHEMPACNTAACIGGWAVILDRKRKIRDWSIVDFNKEGRQRLHLTRDQAAALFGLCYWPSKFSRAYYSAKTVRGKVRIAIRRIDHFIITKGAE